MISNKFDSPNNIIKRLNSAIESVTKDTACYVNNPNCDFTRKRKQPVDELIKFMVLKQAKSIDPELSEYYTKLPKPTPSAFTQQRAKLNPEAFYHVFRLLTDNSPIMNKFHGYRILAADGSDVNIPLNPSDIDTYHPPKKGFIKGYNQLHVNALFDVVNDIYVDLSIDTSSKTREREALLELLKNRGFDSNSIVVCDRGYEGYELIAQLIENHQPFIIRAKDIDSNGILSNLDLPNDEFDITVTKKLTRSQTNKIKNDKDYTFIPNNVDFSFLDNNYESYKLSFRVVRFKMTEDTYECLITTLPKEEFPKEVMKELYHLRWGIEVSFRQLKYNISMIYFHGKSQMFCRQEIYASFIMFNLSKVIVNCIDSESENNESSRKYEYKSRFDSAVTNIRLYLKKMINEEELIRRIKKSLAPIIPERSFTRKIKPQSVKSSQYRAC